MGGLCSCCKKDEKEDKLKIKSVKINNIDDIFNEAASPFNDAVSMRTDFENAVTEFKKAAGHDGKDSLKETVLEVKERFPNLKLRMENGPKFVLTTGQSKERDQNVEDIGARLEESMNKIGDTATELVKLLPDAVSRAKDILDKRAPHIINSIKDSGLTPLQIPGSLKNANDNIHEFKKVPKVAEDIKKTVEEFSTDFKATVEALEGKAENHEQDSDETSPLLANA
ncbi:inactive phospholipase C-like protein 2 [Ptychodera flava]|uniref:inactive phospholipase C-like protein 2 n=1 Tax=Ptychodera flava TaxID=63121 RepID=UPI00396A59E9